MKILMIVTWYGNKKDKFTGNFHIDMAKALALNNEVAIYFPFDNELKEQFSYEIENDILVFRGKISQGIVNRFISTKHNFEKLRKIFNPDVVHAHVCLGAGEIAFFIRMLYGIPYIITEHSPVEMLNLNLRRRLKYYVYTSASKFNVAVSPNLRDRLNKIFLNSKFIYINNGVNNPNEFLCSNNVKIVNDGYTNCTLVGGLYSKEIKGLQYLLPTIKRLKDENVKIKLHICGGGAYLDYFQRMVAELDISDVVVFYGICNKQKVYELVSRMDFNVSASLFESAGVAVEEACMLGKPQVITNSGGANSLIPDKYAIKLGRSSVEELYKGIKEMIFNYDKYDYDEIKNYGLNEFAMVKSCSQYENLYLSILQK